ncbi:MAG: hypothetical protein LQ349_007857 [Xanthoria aureola]|nr:MAG: hypothetical protein LQ349_007857 [Xanthoria aureola]
MPLEDTDTSQQHSVDDSQANIEEPNGQTSDSAIDLDNQNIPAIIIDDHDELDNTMLQLVRLPNRREVIDVDAYDSDVEELDTVPSAFTKKRQVRIKQEDSGDGIQSPMPIDIEILDEDFGGPPSVAQEINVMEADTMSGIQTSLSNADFGKSILSSRTRTAPLNRAGMLEAQRRLIERSLRRPVATGGSSIFGGDIASASQPFAQIDADAEAANRFEHTKQAYLRKKHLGENSFQDDIMWGKEKVKERRRIKHIAEGIPPFRGIDESGDEAAESDNDLFLSQGLSSRKRRNTELIDDSEEDDVDGAHADGTSSPRDVVDILGSEGEANQRIKTKAPSKRKAASNRARDLADARMAGIEEWLINEKRKERKKGRCKPRKKRVTQERPRAAGPLGNVLNTASIRSSNVFDEANRNLDAAPAPTVSSSRKDKALKEMLIDIPLEDLRQARNEGQHILNSTKVLGKHGLCHLAGDGTSNWVLKGMATTLYSYQVQGAAWMKLRETGDVAPYGGILADQMGLGKTLQILACMVANRPEPTTDVKATLIVCTASIAHQWEQEIEKHTQEGVFPIILRERPGYRTGGTRGAQLTLQTADVVVTTYDEVRRSYPKFNPPKHIVLPEKKRAWWDENYGDLRGILHQVHWYRVVLDEAQAIKNRDSQTSVACRGLMAKHRWAVSATPIQNKVGELYAFFKLLRVRHTGDYQTFSENFCNLKDPDCLPRLHALLRQFMMRRTHADTVMGRPLVVLPRNYQRTVTVELNTVERAIYDIVQRRFVLAINQGGRDGNLETRYRSVLHMLLRLRQMTGHPFMLQDIVEKLFQFEDIEKLLALEVSSDTAADDPSRNMLNVMKTMIRAKRSPGSASPGIVSDTTPSESASIVEDDFSAQADTAEPLIFRFKQYLQGLVQGQNWTEMKARSLCHMCGDVPEVPHVTDCYHLYCFECLRALEQEAAIEGEEQASCYECGHRFQEARSCTGIAELEMAPPVLSRATGPSILGGNIGPNRNTDKETMRWINYTGEVLPSTKTAAVVAQIEDWQRAEPDKKIIVFSQFHTLMNVLAKMFAKKEWGFVKFNGRMNQIERDKTLVDFEKDDRCKIMIASLKAGGVGLNLTMASKVICVDLWWNSSVEQQAFCRVFRIGQDSETFITRFVARNTVDDKLQQMQEAKAKAVGHAMDDEKMLKALSLPELLGLFGQVDGSDVEHPFIVVDDEGEHGMECPPTIL